MSVQTQLLDGGKIVRIAPTGRFDFHCHREFRSSYQEQSANVQYVVDLRATDYMDSSALGMLLLLREYAGGDKARIKITGARAEIKSILVVSNFDKLFVID